MRDSKHCSPTSCMAADIPHHWFFIPELCVFYVTHLFTHYLHSVCKTTLGTRCAWVVLLVKHHRHFALLLVL